ncbi:phage tail protein [Salmonella enterica]|uniref:phage tail-collar fiber domain-containing protein n=3 Tax=Salmonella enterica TaxID=28901 RepID=UPI0021D4F2A8|nr:phage tail protein [Salmonella enterica]MCU7148179.1 phage tail protein [Salmonella enterica]
MSAILTKAFEKWVAECTTDNLPARPDAIIFALMEREPSREDDTIPQEKITYTVSELTYGQLNPNSIVCSAVVADDVEFSYDWICLIHQASGTLCGVIKTPVRQKVTGESLIRNFTIIYGGIAQAAQITVPPQSWQVDLFPEINKKAPLDSPTFTGTPTTPTPPDDAVGLEMANAAFVRKLLAALVDSSPEALDTLNELAAALGNDPNFATTMTNALASKQPLSDVLTSLSSLPATGNKMPYFSDKNVMALANLTAVGRELAGQNSKGEVLDYLGLKGAATKDVQTGIRDRTPGRVAIPGAFGYGHMFKSSDALTFRGPSDFAEWLKEATPERYAVSIADSSALLAGTSKFNGIIEVMWSPFDNDESDTTRKFKTLMCYNQYYEGEHSIHRLTYRWSGDNWNATASPVIYDGDSLAFLLSRTAGSGAYYKYPAVGVPVLAVYQGTSAGDREIKIGLGDIVPGSRLGPVAMICEINDQGLYVSTPQVTVGGAGSYSFPGRYQALSGHRAEYGSRGLICLFVRIE